MSEGTLTAGWVYVLTTARPDLVKIGMTGRYPSARSPELAATDAYRHLAPFSVAWSRPVVDCGAVETATHRMLADKRVRGQPREVFRVSVQDACRVVDAAAEAARRRTLPPPRRTSSGRRTWRNRPSLLRRAHRAGQRAVQMVVTAAFLLAALWAFA